MEETGLASGSGCRVVFILETLLVVIGKSQRYQTGQRLPQGQEPLCKNWRRFHLCRAVEKCGGSLPADSTVKIVVLGF